MNKILCFDMDGTLADLYNVPNWLYLLRHENASPYEKAAPIFDMRELAALLHEFKKDGWQIRVITWLSKGSTEEYKDATRKAKRLWLDSFDFPYDAFHGIAYGRTKADSIRKFSPDEAILIDDSEKVRKGWKLGRTIDPTGTDLILTLLEILRSEKSS